MRTNLEFRDAVEAEGLLLRKERRLGAAASQCQTVDPADEESILSKRFASCAREQSGRTSAPVEGDEVPSDLSDAFGVLFVSGFAVQRAVELLDWPLDWLSTALQQKMNAASLKRTLAALVAMLIGVCVSGCGGIDIVSAVLGGGIALDSNLHASPKAVHVAVTALAIGSGTDSINSLLKYATYSKEAKKSALPPGTL